MTLQTDLSGSPYFDDFNESKNYDRILFKPGVAVQTRELNQLQSILQKQIERFGDNILRRGTIVEGCSFTYYDYYPYAKILDSQVDGEPSNVGLYTGHYIKNSSNLVAYVLAGNTGYEAQDPNLSTLFLRYLNSGDTFDKTAFANNDTLTVYDVTYPINKVNVINGGKSFSNSDTVVFLSAIAVDISSSNTFTNAEFITQATTNATAQIVEVNSTAIANTLILKIKPLSTDLYASNTAGWSFNVGYNLTTNGTSNSVANVTQIFGTSAQGSILTDAIGIVSKIAVTNPGSGYEIAPYTTIAPANNSADLTNLNLNSQNYIAQVTVAPSSFADPVGNGYAFGVSEGVIYQKGYFVQVAPQTVVVSKYSATPDQLAVGFDTTETIITAEIDPTLYDNATGSFNYLAPGADRLQLTPKLIVLDKTSAEANTDFFPLTEFSLGLPYKQNQQTQYNIIGDEMSRRLYETSGNFVLDPFLLSVKTAELAIDAPTTFRATIDPGHAYINGKRVKTYTNFSLPIRKGTDELTTNAIVTSVNYGNYVDVKEVGGVFKFSTGDTVYLHSLPKGFLSNAAFGYRTNNTFPDANSVQIGTAKVRSQAHISGIPGTPSATYRLYLFDVAIANGKNFSNTSAVYTNNSVDATAGIADVIKVVSSNSAVLSNSDYSSLLFPIGTTSTKLTNNHTYYYRDIKTVTANTTGGASFTLSGSEFLPYTPGGTLSYSQAQEVCIIPTANLVVTPNLTSAAVTHGNTLVDVTSTANIFPGDYLSIYQTGVTDFRRVSQIINSTSFQIDSAASNSTSGANIVQILPQNVEVPIADHTGRYINVDSTGQILTVNFNANIVTANTVKIFHNVKVQNVSSTPVKTSNRNSIVVIAANTTNAGNTVGPWALGFPDVYRLKSVYLGSNTLTANVTSGTDVTNEFYIDHNQNKDFLGISYLYKKPTSKLTLSANQGLGVVFDHYTQSTGGIVTIDSYSVDYDADASNLTTLSAGSNVSIHEVPEVVSKRGENFDLIDYYDFRPRKSNTVAISTTWGSAPVNPSGTSSTWGVAPIFPLPNSPIISDSTQFLGRVDRIIVDSNGGIRNIEGVPSASSPKAPSGLSDSLTINTINIPPYPSLPQQKTSDLTSIIDTKIANERYTYKRNSDHSITIPVISDGQLVKYQPEQYSMVDIGNLDRRISSLEYYVNLTQTEQGIKDLMIPSGANSAINRFKFGFFADNFDDLSLTDVSNPEYTATILNSEVVPAANLQNFEYRFNTANVTTDNAVVGKVAMLPYTEFNLINQTIATDGAVSNTVVNTTPTQVTVCTNLYKNKNIGKNTIYDFVASSSNGVGSFIYNGWAAVNGFYLYQGLTATFTPGPTNLVKSYLNGALLTSAQLAEFKTSLVGIPNTKNDGHGPLTPGSVSLLGIVSWNHIASKGQYYKMVVTDSSPFSFRICLPIDTQKSNVAVVVVDPPIGKVGTLVSSPASFSIQTKTSSVTRSEAINNNAKNTRYKQVTDTTLKYVAAEQAFVISASGLKSSTTHKFIFDNIDVSAWCKPQGGSIGQPIVTDSFGTANFTYIYPAGIYTNSLTSLVNSDYSKSQSVINNLTGNKTCFLKTADNTSIGSTTVLIKATNQNTVIKPDTKRADGGRD